MNRWLQSVVDRAPPPDNEEYFQSEYENARCNKLHKQQPGGREPSTADGGNWALILAEHNIAELVQQDAGAVVAKYAVVVISTIRIGQTHC